MAYNYHYDIANAKANLIFKLLLRWKGSIWKAVYVEYIIWLFAYAIISVIYRFALDYDQRRSFERFSNFCDRRLSWIPMNFMLGFFVTVVVNRWQTQFANLGMIDNIALFTSLNVRGNDIRGRQLRRNIVRYCVLSQALVFRDIHLGVRKRFPTLETMVAAGFLQKHELEKFNAVKCRYTNYWVPFNWALHLLNVAKDEGRIDGDIPRDAVAQEIRIFRTGLSVLWTYDWVPLPIMYPQLVFLAVHMYFLVCTVARQFIITDNVPNTTEFDLVFPLMSTLEFIFYMGWLKVAMALLNPFGEDDDDLDCNFLLDRNITVALAAVDDAFSDIPDIQQDMFWEDTVSPLYSQDAAGRAVNFYVGSATKQDLPENVKEIVMVPHPMNEQYDEFIQKPARRRRTSIVSVVRTPKMSTANRSRGNTGASIFNGGTNLFRKNSAKKPNVTNKPRASTDIGAGVNVPPNYVNPTFLVQMDGEPPQQYNTAPEDNENHLTLHVQGNVRDHINRNRSHSETQRK